MIFFLGLVFTIGLSAQGWMQWRGPAMNGSTTTTNLPIEWSEQTNIVWAVTMPGKSGSTPAIFNTNIFAVSQGSYGRLLLLNLAMKNGNVLWEKEITRVENWQSDSSFEKGFYSLSSPITNAKNIWALFGSGHIAAYDFAGNELWKRNLPKEHGFAKSRFLNAVTPVFFAGRLYIPLPAEDSASQPKPLLLCLDAKNGETLWIQEWLARANEKQRCGPLSASLYEGECDQKKQLIVSGVSGITGHCLEKGDEIWSYLPENGHSAKQELILSAPVPAPDMGMFFAVIYSQKSLIAIDMNVATSSIEEKDLVWISQEQDALNSVSSPLYYLGKIYVLETDSPSSLVCREAVNGKELWRGRLSVRDRFSSSPTGADDKIYCLSDEGHVLIINAVASQYEEIASIKMDSQTFNSNIAVSNQRLFIRTLEKLYCVKKRQWIRFMDNEFLD